MPVCEECNTWIDVPDWWWEEIEKENKYNSASLCCGKCGHENSLKPYS